MEKTENAKNQLGNSGHIVDMMAHVLSQPRINDPGMRPDYCAYNLDPLERDCESCSLCNYGRDCHNNRIA
jgi:hypothetical protein